MINFRPWRGSPPHQVGLATCNYTKDVTGWMTSLDPDGTIATTTPTGHRHRSRPPDPPRFAARPIDIVDRLAALILEHQEPAA